jgi:Flp pilus assembly protein TadG
MKKTTFRILQRLFRRGVRPALRRFVEDTHGSLMLLTLYLFVIMAFMGGLAIDLMRYEQTRTSLQNTLDRAILASASLTQTLDPDQVVSDYFAKAGMSNYLQNVTVTNGLNFRTVKADASATTDAYFMHLIKNGDINSDSTRIAMTTKGMSSAEQRINSVEISLVLDISSSMGWNNRLVNLKAAAKDFVQSVISNDPAGKIAISIVPFDDHVNLGPDLRSKYTGLTNDQGFANAYCIDLPASTYSSTGIDPTASMPMVYLHDFWSDSYYRQGFVSPTDRTYSIGFDPVYNWTPTICPTMTNNFLRLPTRSIPALNGYIDGLAALGGTAINIGMKWGVTMMDPSQRAIFTSLRQEGKIPNEIPDRPLNYGEKDVLKVIVLMTDGENSGMRRVAEAYKTGLSPIYLSTVEGRYSIRFTSGRPSAAGSNEYYVPHLNAWRSTPYNNGTKGWVWDWGYSPELGWRWQHFYRDLDTTTQLTWPEVWSKMRLSYVAWQFYARGLGYNNWNSMVNNFYAAIDKLSTVPDAATMNQQLQSICKLTKDKGVVVYGIAFEASATGQDQISKCASSPAHYFNAQGLQISTVFRTIANNISQLRLTQ